MLVLVMSCNAQSENTQSENLTSLHNFNFEVFATEIHENTILIISINNKNIYKIITGFMESKNILFHCRTLKNSQILGIYCLR